MDQLLELLGFTMKPTDCGSRGRTVDVPTLILPTGDQLVAGSGEDGWGPVVPGHPYQIYLLADMKDGTFSCDGAWEIVNSQN